MADRTSLGQTRPRIAQRGAAAEHGGNDARFRYFPAGREVLDVASFPSHTWLSGRGSMGRRRRRRVGPTDNWQQRELLCAWEEQREYERIRPLVLFGEPVPERAAETSTSERTLYRRIAGFKKDGMRSLFGLPPTKRRMLPPRLRRLIVDLKAEHPALNLKEIARICHVRAGRVVLDVQVAVRGVATQISSRDSSRSSSRRIRFIVSFESLPSRSLIRRHPSQWLAGRRRLLHARRDEVVRRGPASRFADADGG